MNIIVRMMGGLGNQIFIYAYARYLQIQYPESDIIIDLRWYNKNKIRKYELCQYTLNSKVKTINQTNLHKKDIFLFDITRGSYKVIEKICDKIGAKGIKFLEDGFSNLAKYGYCYNKSGYTDISIPNKENIYVYGYYQNINYIMQVIPELQRDIQLLKPSVKYRYYASKITSNSIAISIRWADDYVKYGWPICTKEYYISGIEEIKKYTNIDSIFLFCDDMRKVEESHIMAMLPVKCIPIEGLSSTEGLSLMMKCKHFVISNSSFSWLGAMFGKKKDSIIVSPKHWSSSMEIEVTSLYLEDMIVLENL